jgi:beta-galactosidase
MSASPLRHPTPPKRPGFLPSGIVYGGDYNPEQWPESVWEDDVRLMADAGINMVCVGIFSWAKLEPEPGRYDFGWMDRVIGLLLGRGIAVCLATGTASPPPWMPRRDPASLPVNAQGVRLGVGSRQHYCPNSTTYREASDALIARLAERYGRHPAVVLWHINNEIGCHVSACYCPACAAGFRRWLAGRYGNLDALNAAWGTAFWSQAYGEWEEIMPPAAMPTIPNPCAALDYRRFMNASLVGVISSEIASLRAVVADAKVTTNGVLWEPAVDLWDCYRHCDIAALDCYPDPADPVRAAHVAAVCHDFYRSFKDGRPFLLMEQVTSQVNWRPVNLLKLPGQMRAMSLATVGRGADGIMFFQWRASRAGAEKFHGAMLPHFGEASRVHREVRGLGADLARLADVRDARTPARVALIVGWQNRWAIELDSKPTTFDYAAIVHAWHRALWEGNIAVDMVEPGADLAGYDVVLAPALYQLEPAQAAILRAHVTGGGALVLGYFSGLVDGSERMWPPPWPGHLAELAGIAVEEWQPVPDGGSAGLRWVGGGGGSGTVLCEVVHARDAEILAVFTDGFLSGKPAVTRRAVGSGEVCYLATQPDPGTLARIFGELMARRGIRPPLQTPREVSADLRTTAAAGFLFVTNHTAGDIRVNYSEWSGSEDVLTGETVPAGEVLPGFGVRVLRQPRTANKFP